MQHSSSDKPTGERGCAYLRVSGDQQPIASQRQQIEAWLSARGLTVARWYIDNEGRNSRHKAEKREDFQRMLADVRDGRWDWVVVDSQDRFGTKHEFERGKFIDAFIDAGCELWSVAQGHLSDPDNPTAVLVGAIGTLTSRDEQKEKGRRTLRGKLKAAKEGLYPGGNVPFAFDVAIYPKGNWTEEKWRVVVLGKNEREKVWPDGRRERYDGKRNFPRHDACEEARYALSIQPGRVEAARQVFEWFATEDVAIWSIAKRLNNAGIKPMSGRRWTARMVEDMLKNPIYLGVQALGKTVQGDFANYRLTDRREPEVIATKWAKNRPVRERRRKAQEWVRPDTFRLPAIVEQATWERVQAKLAAINGPAKPTRSAALWLKRFMVCGHCDRHMRAIHDRTGRIGKQYFCATWQEHLGEKSPSGCRRHPVNHDLIARIVERYIDEKLGGYRALLGEAKTPELLTGLEKELGQKRGEIQAILDRMLAFIRASLASDPIPFLRECEKSVEVALEADEREPWEASERDSKRHFGAVGLADMYEVFYECRMEEIEGRIARLEADLERSVLSFAELTVPAAIEIANKHMEKLSSELESLKSQREPMADRLDAVYNEIVKVKARLTAARKSLAGDEGRRKAEAVAQVIDRIICHFRHQAGRGRQASSVLEKVEIVPAKGDTSAEDVFTELWVDPPPHKKQGSLP
jgi:DNA invertase Pin-like site-specific DNA recombinase